MLNVQARMRRTRRNVNFFTVMWTFLLVKVTLTWVLDCTSIGTFSRDISLLLHYSTARAIIRTKLQVSHLTVYC